jgi:prevent-host-death family protein
MPTFTVHHAKTNLSKLIESAERGEEIIIARGKDPVVRMVPINPPPQKRPFGLHKDEAFELPPEFFEPLPDDELRAWGEIE